MDSFRNLIQMLYLTSSAIALQARRTGMDNGTETGNVGTEAAPDALMVHVAMSPMGAELCLSKARAQQCGISSRSRHDETWPDLFEAKARDKARWISNVMRFRFKLPQLRRPSQSSMEPCLRKPTL